LFPFGACSLTAIEAPGSNPVGVFLSSISPSKGALPGIIIAIVSNVGRRSPAFGAPIVSLPLVAILGILSLWHDTSDIERIAAHAQSTSGTCFQRFRCFL
jgi:hypothetical protein